MKQTPFLLLLSLLLFAGCSDSDFDYVTPLPSANQKVSGRRSFQEALRIAENSTKMLSDKGSRSASTVRAIDPGAIYYVTNRNSRSVGGIDTLMYVFNFANDAGFSLVPINENAPELLGVAEMGHYNPAEEQDNEGFQFYMESATAYLNNLPTGPILPADSMSNGYHYEFVRDTTIISVAPRIPLLWGQGGIIGNKYPSGIAGCANVALGMALAYVREPAQIAITYDSSLYPEGTVLNLDWDLINGHIGEGLCEESNIQLAHEMIPLFMRQLGKNSISTCTTSGTSTATLGIKIAVHDLINQATEQFDNSQYVEAVDSGCVAIIRGFPVSASGKLLTGHAWIYDGYRRRIVQTVLYRYRIENSVVIGSSGVAVQLKRDTVDYSHYNWGWDGYNNGYYYSDVFQPSNIRELDDPDKFEYVNTNYNNSVEFLYIRKKQ